MWQKSFNSNSFNCPRGPNGHWSFCLQQQCSDCTTKKEHFLRFEFPKRERECICSFKFSTLVFFSLPPPFLLPYLLPIISYPLGDPIRATDHRTNETLHGSWHGQQSDSYQLNPLFPPFLFPRIGINAAIFHTGGIERRAMAKADNRDRGKPKMASLATNSNFPLKSLNRIPSPLFFQPH